jgi:predicted O-methyltransferase YrrM
LHRAIAHREVAKVRNGTVRWVRKTGAEAAGDVAAEFGRSIDFVFIDGDHRYEGVKGDWEAWSPLLVPGGVIALHDSSSSMTRQIDDAGSVRFTRDVIRKDPRFAVVEVVDTLTVVVRREDPP